MSSYKFQPRDATSAAAAPSTNLTENLFGHTPRYQIPPAQSGYLTWKKQNEKPKELNMASFSDFPDLGSSPVAAKEAKSGVFAKVSLVDKLKQTIAAEEEEIKRRRLEDHDKEERWLRKNCVALPCKGLKATEKDPGCPTEFHFRDDVYIPVSLFKPKTQEEYSYMRKIAILEAIGADVPVSHDMEATATEGDKYAEEIEFDNEANDEDSITS